jgi:phosphatidylglycerol---prolipoprotein diacylglyceryl transferase
MRPTLFEAFGIRVPSYTFFVAAGLLAGMIVFAIECKRKGLFSKKFLLVFAIGMVGSAVGSKAPFWIAHFPQIVAGFPDLSLLFSGQTIVGGLLGGWIAIEVAKKAIGFTRRTGDPFAPAVALGAGIGRIGCFLRGCCVGIRSSVPWAMDFGDGVLRHPTQLYSSIFDFALFAYLWLVRKRIRQDGDLFKRFLYIYAVFRFSIELIRVTPRFFLALSGYQWVMVAIVAYLLPGDIIAMRKKAR